MGFAKAHDVELLRPFVDRYFVALEGIWASRTNEVAQQIVLGLYPTALADADVVERSDGWLEQHPDAAPALRRLVTENRDAVARALRVQERAAKPDTGLRDPALGQPPGHNVQVILEHALLSVKAGQEDDFESAFGQAKSIIAGMPGFGQLTLSRCIERPGTYLLLVQWDRLEDHTEGFRGSEQYQDWRALLHHFYEPFPTVEHYQLVDTQQFI